MHMHLSTFLKGLVPLCFMKGLVPFLIASPFILDDLC